jgi:TonB family protein
LETVIKVSLVLLAGMALSALLRKRSAAVRHWVLSVSIACAAAAPLLQPFVPRWVMPLEDLRTPESVARRAAGAGVDPPTAGEELPAASSGIQGHFRGAATASIVRGAWIAGTSVSLLILIAGWGRLIWLSSRSRRLRRGRWAEVASEIAAGLGIRRPVSLLYSRHPTLLVTYGWWRPCIVLPAGALDWPHNRIRVVVSHELAHVRRGDWAALLLAELLRSMYWFNPLVWVAAERLRQESERACDDVVLGFGVEGPEYAAHLLDVARAARFRGFPAPAMVRPSKLERRVNAMLDTRVNRDPATPRMRAAAIAAMLAVSLGIAGMGGAAQTFSTFSGSVVDPANSAIPSATLVLTNVPARTRHEVRSDPSGRFEFVGLPPGDYLLEVRFPGFATLKGMVRISSQHVEQNIALQVGSLEETITVSAAASKAAGTAAAPPMRPRPLRQVEACQASATGGQIRPPIKLTHAGPVYPAHLIAEKVAGQVVLHGRIGIDGTVTTLEAVEPVNPDLAAAAIEAVRQWQFTPTLLNCVPIEIAFRATVNFKTE